MSKSTLELLRKQKEKEPEEKRVPEKKVEKSERPKKNKEVNVLVSARHSCGKKMSYKLSGLFN